MFLVLETSPGNLQAWVAIKAAPDKDFMRRLRKGAGADRTASGATRVAGSLNFKDKYAPNFPRVAIREAHPGRVTTPAALEQLGLVAAPEIPAPAQRPPAPIERVRNAGSAEWPDWERCLERAPPSQSGKGNRQSIADWNYALISSQRGFSVDETAGRLLEVSPKARENGRAYAQQTAERAAEAAARNRAERVSRRPNRPTT